MTDAERDHQIERLHRRLRWTRDVVSELIDLMTDDARRRPAPVPITVDHARALHRRLYGEDE